MQVVRNDKLLTEGGGGGTVVLPSSSAVVVGVNEAVPLKAEHSYSNKAGNSKAGSDGDSLPDSPMSFNEGAGNNTVLLVNRLG